MAVTSRHADSTLYSEICLSACLRIVLRFSLNRMLLLIPVPMDAVILSLLIEIGRCSTLRATTLWIPSRTLSIPVFQIWTSIELSGSVSYRVRPYPSLLKQQPTTLIYGLLAALPIPYLLLILLGLIGNCPQKPIVWYSSEILRGSIAIRTVII